MTAYFFLYNIYRDKFDRENAAILLKFENLDFAIDITIFSWDIRVPKL